MSDFWVIQKRVLHTLGDWHIAVMFTGIAEMADHSDEWFQCDAAYFEEEWMLGRRPLVRAREYLADKGYIEAKRAGMPARSWYRLTPKGVTLASTIKMEQ